MPETIVVSENGDEGPKPDVIQVQSQRIYVCRLALAQIRLPADTEELFTVPEARALSAEVTEAVMTALAGDTRVSEVIAARESSMDNARTVSFFNLKADEEELTDAFQKYEGLRFNSPIQFRVRVPAKNQPKYRSMEDVPTDDYLVVWDGVAIWVQWDQTDPRATGSGGHIALEIIEEIGQAAGYGVEIVACSPGCLHRFIHGDFVTFDTGEGPDHFHDAGRSRVGQTIVVPFSRAENDVVNMQMMRRQLNNAVETYAQLRSIADLILLLAGRARRYSSESLMIAYARVSRAPWYVFWRSVPEWFAMWGAARRTRKLISAQWLALATVDWQIHSWRALDEHFQELVKDGNLGELESILDTSRADINALDLSVVRASLEDSANRYEGRLLRISTLAGAGAALIGAVAGAAAAALLT